MAGPVPKSPSIVEAARRYLTVRERPACSNRSPEIDAWLKAVGSPLGSPWCAAFALACLREAGITPPVMSGRVQTLVDGWTEKPAMKDAQPGDLVCFWFPKLKRFAHIGVVVSKNGRNLDTIEGNTIPDGASGDTREGYGVFEKRRKVSDRLILLGAR